MERTSDAELAMICDFAGAMVALMEARQPTKILLQCPTPEAKAHHGAMMRRLFSLGMVYSWWRKGDSIVFVSGEQRVTMDAFRTTLF